MTSQANSEWKNVSIFDIARPKQWKTIPKKELLDEGFPVYGANGQIGYFSDFTHETPTLMITCRGASCGNVHISEPKSYINGNAMALDNLSENVNIKYLYYYLQSANFTEVISGSAQPQITQEGLKKLVIKLAPAVEQKRIADKLDSVLTKVEAAQARLDKIPTILKRFRQSVLAAATSGELTKDWREENESFEMAENTFRKIYKLKQGLLNSKLSKRDLGIVKIESAALPESWNLINLGGLASKITDGEHKTPKRSDSGRYLLSARNVRDGYISLEKVDYVDQDEFEKLRKRCNPDKGDILISCSGSVGRISLCDKDDEYVMVRSAALVKTNGMEQNNTYLMYALQSPILQDVIVEKSKSTAQSNLFLGQIKELPIPVPPSNEQDLIVNKVEGLFEHANAVEKQYNAAKARLDKLTQSILAKAFRGELTAVWRAQHPDLISGDNSAEALLAKIKAER